jgi:hypothetical protein
MAVLASSLHKPFDLTLGQVFTLAVMGVNSFENSIANTQR